MPPTKSGSLKIGLLSRLSGVPIATIRMWERRYNSLSPSRSPGGNRLYSQADLTRLTMLKRLADQGHAIGNIASVSTDNLQQLCAGAGLLEALISAPAAAAVYSASELAKLAASPTTIRCECPRQLADLVLTLRAFEQYSAECTDLNPQDAAVHGVLRNIAGHARSLLEEGLRRVVAAEALDSG